MTELVDKIKDIWEKTKPLRKSHQSRQHAHQAKVNELLVLIDTLQSNLRSAVSMLSEEKKKQIEGTPSYRWVSKWTHDTHSIEAQKQQNK